LNKPIQRTKEQDWQLDGEPLKVGELVFVTIAHGIRVAGRIGYHREGYGRLWVVCLNGGGMLCIAPDLLMARISGMLPPQFPDSSLRRKGALHKT